MSSEKKHRHPKQTSRRAQRSHLSDRAVRAIAADLSESIDHDPFKLIGYASIAASTLLDDLGDFLDRLACHDPRLQPVLATIVDALPMIDHVAPPPRPCEVPLPSWLDRLDDATITRAMRRFEDVDRSTGTYLLEVALPSVGAGTAVVTLARRRDGFAVSDLYTIAGTCEVAAKDLQLRFEWLNRRPFEVVPLDTAVGTLVAAMQLWLQQCDPMIADHSEPPRWPFNAPELAWILTQGIRQLDESDAA